jgi:hypothetical protein
MPALCAECDHLPELCTCVLADAVAQDLGYPTVRSAHVGHCISRIGGAPAVFEVLRAAHAAARDGADLEAVLGDAPPMRVKRAAEEPAAEPSSGPHRAVPATKRRQRKTAMQATWQPPHADAAGAYAGGAQPYYG